MIILRKSRTLVRKVGNVVYENAPAEGLVGEALSGIERRSAIDAVRLRIGMAISLGMLKPGERLPDQEQVAKGLSVSPITARRALTRLAEDGVLVRRRGRHGGTFVVDDPPVEKLRQIVVSTDEMAEVHQLIDRRLLMECALTHFAALRVNRHHLRRLGELTRQMAETSSWSTYHQADKEFHHVVAEAATLGPAASEYHGVLHRLYGYFIPYPIEQLHASNQDHLGLVEALGAGNGEAAVELSRLHVERLHHTMFVGLLQKKATSGRPES